MNMQQYKTIKGTVCHKFITHFGKGIEEYEAFIRATEGLSKSTIIMMENNQFYFNCNFWSLITLTYLSLRMVFEFNNTLHGFFR